MRFQIVAGTEEEVKEVEEPNELPPIKPPTPVPPKPNTGPDITLKPADREATLSQTGAGNQPGYIAFACKFHTVDTNHA